MLEIKNLSKVYKPKKGVPVTALDNISLCFPETGMVFLLGKSGSGKSTLLNLLGGLDKYDDGELVINGVSSKDFKQSHFDSYRNTYVGFIFQEYNVLDEFTVGANIALAIELQGKKADDDTINDILRRVDLDGYGARRPSELSGGQKQRVAIARALVKNPEIIMADEPTGALDSATGKQVLDTLKKLSKEKLVIVVSHDREFAERYADRIIELSDGHVISDMERDCSAPVEEESAGLEYNDGTISVPAGYHLTDADREEINRYIDSLSGKGAFIKSSSKKSVFAPTDIEKTKKSSNKAFELIKSRLPMKSAVKIGASSLKHKKIRLVVTILLSCIAFGLFGLSDTFGAYDHVTACTNSILDTGVNYSSLSKSVNIGTVDNAYWMDWGNKISDEDIAAAKKRCGVDFYGVYVPLGADLSFDYNTDTSAVADASESQFNIYMTDFSGFCDIDETVLAQLGYKLLAGSIPDGSKNELAISDIMFETFKIGGYKGVGDENTVKINTYKDIVGKTLMLDGTEYTVSGVVDTKTDISRYKGLLEDQSNADTATNLVNYALYNEYGNIAQYSFVGLAMTGKGHTEKMAKDAPHVAIISVGWIWFNCDTENSYISLDASYFARLEDMPKDNINIVWFGEEKQTLGEKELVVSLDLLKSGGYEYMMGDTAAINYGEAGEDSEFPLEKFAELDFHLNGGAPDTESASGRYEYYEENGYKIVGYYDNTKSSSDSIHSTIICNDTLIEKHTTGTDGVYSFILGSMPEGREGVRSLVEGCYDITEGGISFSINNSATYELDTVNSVLKSVSKVFFWIGVGFAAFAALMLANFIATSITYKKQEIGILRAIGSSGSDVFRIFFSESLIIALINFVLSAIGVAAATAIVNYILRHDVGILVTVLHFGVRQILLLLVLSVAIAALASFFPVKRIASKKPIDAIRNR